MTNKKFITREFNTIQKKSHSVIQKQSKNIAKIHSEFLWYQKMPASLQKYIPIAHQFYLKTDGMGVLEIEYIDANNLAMGFTENHYPVGVLQSILDQIIVILEAFHAHKDPNTVNTEKNHQFIYWDKTIERTQQLEQHAFFKQLLQHDVLWINNKQFLNWFLIKDKIFDLIKQILIKPDKQLCIVHGDLFFGNILYCHKTKDLKLIDPRGYFFDNDIYGDLRYDLAKIAHSISGKYDFIIYNKYSLEIDQNHFHYSIDANCDYDSLYYYLIKKAAELFSVSKQEIDLIEALLFLTMIPLHSENLNNQIIFYLIAIQKLNFLIN